MNTLYSAWRVFRTNRFHSLCKSCRKMTTLETLNFDNLALKKLPIDEESRNYVRTVRGACFSLVGPTPVKNPTVVAVSYPALAKLGLSEQEVNRKEFVEYFSGNKPIPGSKTAAHCYCGHQFGSFAGQLGDGAAIYLGEIVNDDKERWEIQLKGAGLTPYSRTADGRKVLRSSIREFLCSEAMFYLGIPTTRAGACITSDSEVIRDILYDGNASPEKCTIVLRMAQTFIRFGSFEIFKFMDQYTGRVGPSVGRKEILVTLLHYVIETFYKEIYELREDEEAMYAAFLKEVVRRTAVLVAEWQCVGFCHGVLNTDNMSIVGLTLDYGPFGFLDNYNADHVCNGSDATGRYSYASQPDMCQWNLLKLAEAIQTGLSTKKAISRNSISSEFRDFFESHYLSKMKKKLGLLSDSPEDKSLIGDLLSTMQDSGSDFTNTFLLLQLVDASSLETSIEAVKMKLLGCLYPLKVQVEAAKPKFSSYQLGMFKRMVQPENIGRWEEENLKRVRDVLARHEKAEVLAKITPEEKASLDDKLWTDWLSKYRARIAKDAEAFDGGCSRQYNDARLRVMKENNPRFILRNYICQNAIESAEKGDFSEVRRVLESLKTPYDIPQKETSRQTDSDSKVVKSSCAAESDKFDQPPDWSFDLKVT